MAAYTTLARLIERYGETELIQLTDRIGAGVVDATLVARMIDDGAAEIDAYIARRMTLPLADPPPLLERLNATLARCALFANPMPEEVVRSREAAIRLLRDIANGVASLGAGDVAVASGEVAFEFSPRAITDDTLRGFA